MCASLPDKTPETELRHEVWTIAGRRFDLTWPADMDALLDSPETRRRFARDEYMPYWAQPWPVSVLMAEALLRGPVGEGRAAIEIGCGIGLASIAAAMMGWLIRATDYEARALEFARLNAEASGVTLAGIELLDYREPLDRPQYDLVIGSDLLYERKKSPLVASWLASALNPAGTALIGDPHRTAADGFPEELARVGLVSQVQSAETVSPAGPQIRGRIWQIARQEPSHGVSPGAL